MSVEARGHTHSRHRDYGVAHDLDVLIGQAECHEPHGLMPRRTTAHPSSAARSRGGSWALKDTADGEPGTAMGRKGGGRTSIERHEISGEIGSGQAISAWEEQQPGRRPPGSRNKATLLSRRAACFGGLDVDRKRCLLRCALSVQPCEVSDQRPSEKLNFDVVVEFGQRSAKLLERLAPHYPVTAYEIPSL